MGKNKIKHSNNKLKLSAKKGANSDEIAFPKIENIPYQHGTESDLDKWWFRLDRDYNLSKPEGLTNNLEINSQLRAAYAKAIELAKWWICAETAEEVGIVFVNKGDAVEIGKDPKETFVTWNSLFEPAVQIKLTKEDKQKEKKKFNFKYYMEANLKTFSGTRYDHIMLSSGFGAIGVGLYPVESEADAVVKVYKINDLRPVGRTVTYKVKIDLDNPAIEPDLQGPHGPHVGYEVHKIGTNGVENVVVGHVLININEKLPSRHKTNHVPFGLRTEDEFGKRPVKQLMNQCNSNFNLLPYKESPEILSESLQPLNEKSLKCVGPVVKHFIHVSRAFYGPQSQTTIESLRCCLQRKDKTDATVVSQASEKLEEYEEKTFVEIMARTKFDRPQYPSADF